MELEQRVKALEQEVEILKNQIQATLLDIRETLLTSAYPSLRAGENAKQTEPKRPVRTAQPVQEQPEDEMPDETPVVRKVVVESAGSQPEVVVPPSNGTRHAKSVRQAAQREEEALDETSVVRKVVLDSAESQPEAAVLPSNGARHAKSVRQAAQREEDEHGQPDQKPLVRKVPLHEEQTPTTGRHKPKAQSAFEDEQANLEAWVHDKVEQVGISRTWELIQLYAQKGHITPEIEEMLMQALAPYAEQLESELPQHTDGDTEPGDNTQRMVLKLIAGVQNAGVGLVRRKKHNG